MKENLYEPCQFHENEFLQMICQQCEEACLACPMCIDQFHDGHAMISLKKFITNQIPKLYHTKPSLQKMNNKIESIRSGFIEGFQEMRKRIGQEVNSIEEVYNNEAEKMKMEMEVIAGQGRFSLQSITAIKHKIKHNLMIPNDEILESKFQTILSQVSSLLSQITENICRTINSLKEYWELSCGVILNSKRKFKHYFSKDKHQSIEIQAKCQQKDKKSKGLKQLENSIAINTNFDGKYHIAVVEPPLNPFKNQVKFKIQESTNNCVWIGVCDLQKVKEKGFENCFKKGQGCYWIWQSGGEQQCQFFSSLLEESVSLETCIKVGDSILVRLEYLPGEMNLISFYKIGQGTYPCKKGKEQEKTLIYSAQIEKKQFHACVALGDELEKVSIRF